MELEVQLFIQCCVHVSQFPFATAHTERPAIFYRTLFSLCTDYAVGPGKV